MVLVHDERTAQFDGLAQDRFHVGGHAKQRIGVEALDAVLLHDLVAQSQAIGADELSRRIVPDEKLAVVAVVTVCVDVVFRTLADFAEGYLAQPADLVHQVRDMFRRCKIDFILPVAEEQVRIPDGLQIVTQQRPVDSRGHRFGRTARRPPCSPSRTVVQRFHVFDVRPQETTVCFGRKFVCFVGNDRRTDPQPDRPVVFVQQFVG